ncbi:hypothetical protein F5Y00DRAFT_265982 [Daldinia vernicosa]|uniref:uncharacterized protein n=1 Tax=Daldinia vernicosa TaxID=114800 RepID=UPI002007B6D6|nr:uncharacterized protein F5Y00DRAFT_265982 [Daldinia vernicosa]KAI0845016.1 hypothetical protein F5Y00DRAFT_265982 [Daldinia vernicosa]
MTYTLIVLLQRKEGISSSQFRMYYDTVHVPLLKSLFGSTMPSTHTRYYISRDTKSEHGHTDSTTPPERTTPNEELLPTIMHSGKLADIPFDSLTVMTWESKESRDAFLKIFYSKSVAEKLGEDEENFADREKRLIFSVGDSTTTIFG